MVHANTENGSADGRPRGTLVVCFGNAFRGDDAFGLAVADRLGGALAPHADLLVLGGDALGLFEAWRGYVRVILVDALASEGPPGKLFYCDLSQSALPFELKGTSTHAFTLAGAVEMARALGALPPRVEVLAATACAFSPGVAMSPELEAQLDPAVQRILDLVVQPVGRMSDA